MKHRFLAVVVSFWVFYNCVMNTSLHICNVCKAHEGSLMECACEHHKHNEQKECIASTINLEDKHCIIPDSGKCSEVYYTYPLSFQPLYGNSTILFFPLICFVFVDIPKKSILLSHFYYFLPYKPKPLTFNSILLI
ncbi:MAG: hypothetical protein HUU50_10455 [Candidatus Brocadiae bacterium]|nr:hypothetical protein [Candidatus Brocadiia bacterium]